MNAMKQLFSKKRLPWIFVHLLLGMWGGAAHGQLADYVYYNSEGDASDQHGALMIIDKAAGAERRLRACRADLWILRNPGFESPA